MRKILLFGGMGIVILLVGVAVFLMAGTDRTANQPEVASTLNPTPLASTSPDLVAGEAHKGSFETHQKEGQTNPVLTKLPHNSRYWSLTFAGSTNGKYRLKATVFYIVGREQPEQMINRQRTFVEQYLQGIGQPAGTYEVKYVGQPITIYPGD